MGMLSTYRENRANRRAHVTALKSRVKLEAKLAAKETRAKAKETHELAMKAAQDQARTARTAAKTEAKDLRSAARHSAKQAERATVRGAKQAQRAVEDEAKKAHKVTKNLANAAQRKQKAAVKQLKEEARIEKAGRKHERALAEIELAKIDASKFGKKDVQRWLGVATTAAPVLVPLLYKGLTSAQGQGLSAASIPGSAGPGAALDARIARISTSLDRLNARSKSEPSLAEFLTRTQARLSDLSAAVEAAEAMPTSQRREVHASISKEVDRANRDVVARLGVKA